MSERTVMVALCASLSAAPALAQDPLGDCLPLPAGFELCLAGSPWAGADVMAFDNGIAVESDMTWIEVSAAPDDLDMAVALDDLLPALQALIAEQARNEGFGAAETLADTRYQTEYLDVISVQTRIDLPEDAPLVFISLVAQSDGRRLLVTLNNDAERDLERLEAELAEFVALIRPLEG
ncbi:MAG: hypothetical protein ACXIU7_00255 [Roseinatronobacter sp.]